MKEFVEKLIKLLKDEERDYRLRWKYKGEYEEDWQCMKAMQKAIGIVEQLAEEHNNGWIPCEVVDHPEHCHDCEVTIKDVYGYTREIAYYTDKWRKASDETPVMVLAWKEPSAPYKKGE